MNGDQGDLFQWKDEERTEGDMRGEITLEILKELGESGIVFVVPLNRGSITLTPEMALEWYRDPEKCRVEMDEEMETEMKEEAGGDDF